MTTEKQLQEALQKVKELESKIENLEHYILYLRTQLFGKKSEKRLSSNPDDLQPTLFDDLLTPEEKQKIEAKRKQEQQEITKAVSYTRKAKNNRAVLNTEGLPVEEEVLLPDGINDQTLPLYTELEPKVTNKLCIRPAQVYIKRIIRRQFVLKSSHQQKESNNATFLIAPLLESALYKCMADTSILVDIFIDKYLYHLPFHRVIQKYKELGVQLNDTTIYDWFAATCVRLRPIYEALRYCYTYLPRLARYITLRNNTSNSKCYFLYQ